MNVVVSGTSSGIGRAIAWRFARSGHRVYGVDVRGATIGHPRYTHYVCDIRDELPNDLPASPEVVINNAGTLEEDDAIAVRLEKKHGTVVLTTENSIRAPLPEETLTHLFDRFYRPDASRSKDSGGYGLGLSMVRAAAEKHGGSAHAEQTPDGLIRFVCALPAESRS